MAGGRRRKGCYRWVMLPWAVYEERTDYELPASYYRRKRRTRLRRLLESWGSPTWWVGLTARRPFAPGRESFRLAVMEALRLASSLAAWWLPVHAFVGWEPHADGVWHAHIIWWASSGSRVGDWRVPKEFFWSVLGRATFEPWEDGQLDNALAYAMAYARKVGSRGSIEWW